MTHLSRKIQFQIFHFAIEFRFYPNYFRVFNWCPKHSLTINLWSFVENALVRSLSLCHNFFYCLGTYSCLNKTYVPVFCCVFFAKISELKGLCPCQLYPATSPSVRRILFCSACRLDNLDKLIHGRFYTYSRISILNQ